MNFLLHCYSIGHSNHPMDLFIKLIKRYDIDTLVDVRSYPYSQHQPQYNQENLKKSLNDEKIIYVFQGKLLGGLYKDPKYLSHDGIVDYNKVKEQPEFQEGIKNVELMIKEGKNIVLMCSEKDPFDCHRFVLISKELNQHDVSIDHILNEGGINSQIEMESRLRSHYHAHMNTNLEDLYIRRNRDLFRKKPKQHPYNLKDKTVENHNLSEF